MLLPNSNRTKAKKKIVSFQILAKENKVSLERMLKTTRKNKNKFKINNNTTIMRRR